ncbi:YjcQ family protein [uncultured Acidaminococcus sp.]|uniref:YjcQ family protein n=1 Tax=uncultured Acidaminococcus sp. TaxID=352152 RepID=UPI0026764D41|nr:YjcQ family protein [uncultured Acidaminococcus sp.]
MTVDNFKLIYRILKYIEACMGYEQFDDDNFAASHFGVSKALFLNILQTLLEAGYISGIKIVTDKCGSDIALINPHLTVAGMEYLADNTMMKKAYRQLKGIEDITPGA